MTCAVVQYRQDACTMDPWILNLHKDPGGGGGKSWFLGGDGKSDFPPSPDEYDFGIPLSFRCVTDMYPPSLISLLVIS